MTSLREKVVRGGIWSVSLSYLQFVLTFSANVVIARCLGPSPYGPFVMLTSLQSLVCLFFIYPVSMAYVRSEGAQRDFDNTWVAGAFIGLFCLAAGVVGGAYFWWRHEMVSAILFFVLCLAQSPLVLSSIYLATFEKHFQFKSSLLITVCCTLAGALLAVVAGCLHAGIWALLIRETLPSFLIFFAAAHFSAMKFKKTFERSHVYGILREGFKFWTSRSLEQLFFRVPFLAIGAWWGQEYLGNFSQAFYVASLPNTALGPLTQTVAFPAYSVLDRDEIKFQQAFRVSIFVLLRLSVLIGAGFYLLGDRLIRLLYGTKWIFSEPLVVGLWLFAALAPFFSNLRAACYGKGKQNRVSWAYIFSIVFLGAALRWAPHGASSALWVPYAYGVALLVGTVYCFYVSWNDHLQAFLRGVLSRRFLFFTFCLTGLMWLKGRWPAGPTAYTACAVAALMIASLSVMHECHLHVRR